MGFLLWDFGMGNGLALIVSGSNWRREAWTKM